MEQRAAWLGVERPAIECAVLATARRIGAGSLQGKRGVEFPVGHPRGAVTTRLAAVSGRARKGCMATSPMWQRPGSRHPDVHARAGSGSACPGSAHSPWDSRAPALDCLPRQLTIPAEGPAEVLDYAESHGIDRHSQSQREEDASRVAGPSGEGWFRMAARSRQRRNWRPGSVSGIEWPVTVSSFPSFWGPRRARLASRSPRGGHPLTATFRTMSTSRCWTL